MLFYLRKGKNICQKEMEPALPVVAAQEAAVEAAAESKPIKLKKQSRVHSRDCFFAFKQLNMVKFKCHKIYAFE